MESKSNALPLGYAINNNLIAKDGIEPTFSAYQADTLPLSYKEV
jgi:hypothetical protein